MTVITLEDLSRAIANRIGIDIEEARRDASFVMDIFGFDDRVIDNVLDPEGRQLFYILEEEGMLSTEREETKRTNGTVIPTKQSIETMDDADIYLNMDDEIWISRKKRD